MDWKLDHCYDHHGQAVRYATQGEGPPLVFVHGTPFSSYVWRRIAPHFYATHRVYCYDLLGYGQSSQREGQDVSLGVQGELFAALLDHWRVDRPHVVAHDFGGCTALRAHLLGRRDYASLTLIDPVALSPWGSPLVQHVRQHQAAFADLPEYVHHAVLAAYIRGGIRRALSDDELNPYLAPWLGAVGQAAFYRQIAQMDQRYTDEITPLYREMRCPTSVLWGEEDRWIPAACGRSLQQMIPGAQLRMIANAGHLVQEDAPEAIVAALMGALFNSAVLKPTV